MIKWKKETKGEEGMTLDYGIALRNGKITCEKITHLPIFLLSLDQRHLNQGLREFKNDNDPSEYEKTLQIFSKQFVASDARNET